MGVNESKEAGLITDTQLQIISGLVADIEQDRILEEYREDTARKSASRNNQQSVY